MLSKIVCSKRSTTFDRSVAWVLMMFALPQVLADAAEDWPMWRYDAQRTAASQNTLPELLHLLWQREFSPRVQAWDDPLNLDLMTYDRVFEPIVMQGRMFIGFNDSDKLVAFDANTGRELWTVYAEGPVRLPPVGFNGRVYFCSDDGYLYCVEAADGQILWKFNAAPNSQTALGNKRLVSAWPARGGPVIRDGTVYFAASIWPFMGTFICALDADSGNVKWMNDSTGSHYIKQPHSAPSFAGVAPQGALVATQDRLIVPGGRSVPAVFDRADGQLQYFELNAGGKGTGGSFVVADEKNFYVHTREKGTRAFDIQSGLKTAFMPNEPVLANGVVYAAEEAKGTPVVRAYGLDEKMIWEVAADGRGDLVLAGDKLVAAGRESLSIIALPNAEGPGRVVFSMSLDADVQRLLVADGKLLAVTLDGRIMAFGNPVDVGESLAGGVSEETKAGHLLASEQAQMTVDQLLAAGHAEGFSYWFGKADNSLLQALATKLPFEQLAVIDSDISRVNRLRRQLDRHGILGRMTVHLSEAANFMAPRYSGHVVFVADDLTNALDDAGIAHLYQAVRPYGGVMHLLTDKSQELASRLYRLSLEQSVVEVGEHGLIVRREGALPGSADWTHQYGDVANSIKSDDRRVKLPLGVLWFGGSSNMDVLPRHGHGPPEQVVGGRLFIQGMNSLSCRDVYTGRVLWKREFEDLGTFDVYFDDTYDDSPLDPKYNQVHIPGANARGTNYVVTQDRVYLVEGSLCHILDPQTGETLQDIHLPTSASGEQESWGYIGVYEDVLIGGLGFARYVDRNGLVFETDQQLASSKAGFGSKSLDRAGSMALIGFDRHSGEQLWKVDAKHSFWHNGIVAGGERIYCLDKNPQQIEDALRRRGTDPPTSYRILAFDYRTGQTRWEVHENIFGTWLGYSKEHDLILQAGAKGSDRLHTEIGQGMAVYSARDGQLQWKNDSVDYAGPCILHNDLIITNANSYTESAGAFYLKTGKQRMVKNPLTGELQPWKVTRAYGCNSIVASENMLTFRSGAAGFYDLLTDSGTGNLGGFKSGCTSNLVVANGVLNAPDYTRTCSCAYQNQTSLALVHMPDMDQWTVNTAATKASADAIIRNLAINFGAPGDRRDPQGALWLEYPIVSDPSPPISVELNPEASFFQFHSSSMQGQAYPWILASGIDGVTDLRVRLKLEDSLQKAEHIASTEGSEKASETTPDGARELANREPELKLNVRLFMAVPPLLQTEDRVFDIYAGGELVLIDVTLPAADGSPQALTEYVIKGVPAVDALDLRFVPKRGKPVLSGIEITVLP